MNSEEFMMIIAQKCSSFFKEMHELCDAYAQQVPIKKKIGNRSGVPKNSEIKDPDMPKKPSTAYILYFKNRKEKFISQYPNFAITDITKLIAKEWGELTKEKQFPFLRDAERAKLDYIEKMKEYASKHPGIKIPGEGRRRKNRPQGPLYQDAPIKKDGLLDGTSEDDVEEDEEEEEIELSNQHIAVHNNNINTNIPVQTHTVKQQIVPHTNMNGKRKIILSDEENDDDSNMSEPDQDSFDEIPIKKIKS